MRSINFNKFSTLRYSYNRYILYNLSDISTLLHYDAIGVTNIFHQKSFYIYIYYIKSMKQLRITYNWK